MAADKMYLLIGLYQAKHACFILIYLSHRFVIVGLFQSFAIAKIDQFKGSY